MLLSDFSFKIKNYKCFRDSFQGFSTLLPINILIGRNNSGKSSLLELIEMIITNEIPELVQSRNPVFSLTYKLQQQLVTQMYPPTRKIYGHLYHDRIMQLLVDSIVKVEMPLTGFKNFRNRELTGISSSGVNIDISQIPEKENILRDLGFDFSEYRFVKLNPDRDIVPEEIKYDNFSIQSNGAGATTVIHRVINDRLLQRELVEDKMLIAMNKILYPDLEIERISTMRDSENRWEIYLDEKSKGTIAVSNLGSGVKTVILVLCLLIVLSEAHGGDQSKYVYAFEELENNLHPALQRRLFDYIYNYALERKCHFLLATHSGVILDMFGQKTNAQILHVTHNGTEAEVNPVIDRESGCKILDDMDIRASDLLQSNSIIWVEGPSDRVYLNRWIELISEGELEENYHYQCMFYGGKLLSHIKAQIDKDTQNKRISILTLNRHAIILMDSDYKSEKSRINNTKARVKKQIHNAGGLTWITKGREIENYIPLEITSEIFNTDINKDIGLYQRYSDYLEQFDEQYSKKFLQNKFEFAVEAASKFTIDMIKKCFDLEDRLNEICNRIRQWNNM